MPFASFRHVTYFATLDRLCAVSVLLVVAIHSGDPLRRTFNGRVGVAVFFVISGWLITTLLLREEAEGGTVRLGAFYARRAFRLLPVYLVGSGGSQAASDVALSGPDRRNQ